jgi:uncharacterized protein (TIRG00374 family)
VKIKRAVVSLGVITLFYLSVLIWADSKKHVFELMPVISGLLPVLMSLSAVSYLIRYFRWHWLLGRAGFRVSFQYGFLAYLAGFSFTATPGKVGELVRIRYLQPRGVPHYRVVSAFIFERVFDLIVVLMLASMVATQSFNYMYAATFVVLVIVVVIAAARYPGWIGLVVAHLRVWRMRRLSRWLRVIRDGLAGIRMWANPLDMVVVFITGFLAWGIISVAFIILLTALDIEIPMMIAVAIYPLSMLVGAASMLPGGMGTTEAAITAMLLLFDVSIDIAILAAVGIRIATIWFAILCGLTAMLLLERRMCRVSAQ